ncbi:MAG: WD40/YVTN/BNR-like repeat-containing protein [Candidatus Kapaibacterium sp.]
MRFFVLTGLIASAHAQGHWDVYTDRLFGVTPTVNTLITTKAGVILAGTEAGVYRSVDRAENWAAANDGLLNTDIQALATDGTVVFAGTRAGLYRSSDDGRSWTNVNRGEPDSTITALAMGANVMYAGTPKGLYRSADNGISWTAAGLKGWINDIEVIEDTIVIALSNFGLYRSTTGSSAWVSVSDSIGDFPVFCTSGSALYAASLVNVFRSTDNGNRWKQLGSEIPFAACIHADGSEIIVTTHYGYVYRSSDNGDTWMRKGKLYDVLALLRLQDTLIAGSRDGVYRSTDDGATWKEADSGFNIIDRVNALGVLGPNVVAGTRSGGLYVGTDAGRSWERIRGGNVNAVATSGDRLFCGSRGGISHSVDLGKNWSVAKGGVEANAFTMIGDTMFCGTNIGVFRSTDQGISWTQVSSEMKHPFVRALASRAQSIFTGNDSGGVYRGDNYGVNWTRVSTGLMDGSVYGLATKGKAIFASTSAGVFRSADNGESWKRVKDHPAGTLNYGDYPLAISNGTVYSACSSGVFRSTDNGDTWMNVSTGIPAEQVVISFVVNANTLYAGTDKSSIYTWVEATSDVNDHPSDALLQPSSLSIRPEPASDELTLRFTVVGSRYARVYALRSSGDIQAQIADGMHDAGEHTVNVDTRSWPSGVYCIVVQTETDVARKTVVVVR